MFCLYACPGGSLRSVASLGLSASWQSHIPFGRSFSCQGSSESKYPPSSLDKGVQKNNLFDRTFSEIFKLFTNFPHLLRTRGSCFLALIGKFFEKSPHLLRTNTCRNTPVLSKKVFSFFCRIGYPSPYTNPPSFLNPLNEKTLIFLSRHIKNKARKRNCSNVPKNNRTKEEVFSRSRGKDFFRRASYPSIKKRRGSKMIQSSRIILTRTALCSPTINGTALVRIENDIVIP